MDTVTHRYREALARMRERAESVEGLAWWFARYATEADFRQEEDQRAVEATDGTVSPLDAHLWILVHATGRTTLPWDEAPRDGGACHEMRGRRRPQEETSMFLAQKTFENGTADTKDFSDDADMCRWFADDPDAGIAAWEDGEPVDQRQLQADVAAYRA